jgi:pyruvate,orthophosphate dikinase
MKMKTKTKKWVYFFEEGGKEMRDLLGGKGAGLAEMARIGLPVPPGFTITTEACNQYLATGKFPKEMWEQTLEAMREVERRMGRGFGSPKNPLLVSVRSGAKFSMPGMMDTVLNLGLNDSSLEGLIDFGGERFAYDAYRRLIQMFGKVVMGIDGAKFESILEGIKREKGLKQDTDLTAKDLKEVTEEFKKIYREEGLEFPQEPYEQLKLAIKAVFDSWYGKRVVDYRNFHGIPYDLGTAANVVAMVFGNIGLTSGSGVAFTRDPATGKKEIFGEYLLSAQGEDVVAGIRTPKPIKHLKEDLPEVYEEFVRVCDALERHYRDMQDVEFTIERGKLWMLQTRTGKRTAQAAIRIAVEMAQEGLITKEEAVLRIEPGHVEAVLHPRFDEHAKEKAKTHGDQLAEGLNASPGAAVGQAVFDADTAEKWGQENKPVILIRPETTPDDVHGMLQAKGILTQHGGATSHAAVVARGLGVPAVVGCEAIKIDPDAKGFTANGKTIKEGDWISIDGSTGEVFQGKLPTHEPKLEEQKELLKILSWADEFRRLGVWANADYPRDAKEARRFGAEGIGLCRTEHMFFEEERLPIVRKMILAESSSERKEALDKLLPIQKEDFKQLFEVMEGLPVIIRLIDPPLHEFLPSYEELLREVTKLQCTQENPSKLAELEDMLKKVEAMREANPMMGLRGVRLGILWPEINKMQVRAIFEAACELKREGVEVYPEVMIPLISHVKELERTREFEEVAKEVMKEHGVEVKYKFGTMIEVPRAALTASQIAKFADFFSFGTNDLTQLTYGISRDDAEGKFLMQYVEQKILPENPFQVLDCEGVGELMRMAVERGREANPDLEVGICGEHGGEPKSIEFCHQIGLDYVSCSPFRVPVARLAAAQAALEEKEKAKERSDV